MKKTKLLFSKYFLFSLIVHLSIISFLVYLIYEKEQETDRSTIEIGLIDSQSGDLKKTVQKKKRSQKITKKHIRNSVNPKLFKKNDSPDQTVSKKLKIEEKLPLSNVKVVKNAEKSISAEVPLRSYSSDASTQSSNLVLAHPDYKYNPKPNYPLIAKHRGYEGTVLLNVFVLESGRVGELSLQKASGHPILDKSAIDSVKKWIFVPGKRNGIAVSSWVQVPIKFQLTNL